MSKQLLVASKHFVNPFTNKRVLKGQLVEVPKEATHDHDGKQWTPNKRKQDEVDRITQKLKDDGAAEMGDTALGPYNPGEPDSPGATEGIHFNVPPEAVQHDGTIESAQRLKQLRINAAERQKVADRKAQQASQDAASGKVVDQKLLEGGEAAKEILEGGAVDQSQDPAVKTEPAATPATTAETDKAAEKTADKKTKK